MFGGIVNDFLGKKKAPKMVRGFCRRIPRKMKNNYGEPAPKYCWLDRKLNRNV